MPLPDITHLQFLVLTVLGGQQRSGREVRDGLREEKVRKSAPAFYQLMARLEEAKLVKGWYEREEIDGLIVRQRWYKVTASGVRAWNGATDFYRQWKAAMGQGGLANV